MKTNGRNLDSYEKAYRLICKRMDVSNLVSRKSHCRNGWYICGGNKMHPLRTNCFCLCSRSKLASKKDFIDFILQYAAASNVIIYAKTAVLKDKSGLEAWYKTIIGKGSTIDSLAIEHDLSAGEEA